MNVPLPLLLPIPLSPLTPPPQGIGDTKSGTLIGTDRFGNRFYENTVEELPLRTKWVDYKHHFCDASETEPGWHAWLHHMVDNPPTKDSMLQPRTNAWSQPTHVPNMTFTRSAYKPYSTVRNRIEAWVPQVKPKGEINA